MSAISMSPRGTGYGTPRIVLTTQRDRTRSDAARERTLTRKRARAARAPMPLDLDRLAADMGVISEPAR